MIQFPCPRCGKAVEIDDAFAGGRGRCPACRAAVDIPRRPAALGAQVGPVAGQRAGPAVGEPERGQSRHAGPGTVEPPTPLAGRGPRKLTIPESVAEVRVPSAELPPESAPDTGRAMAIAGLVLGFIPLLSAVGIVLGGLAWRRAKRAGARGTKRLAVAATILAILMTLASAALMVAGFVAVIQEVVVGARTMECQSRLMRLGMAVEQYASQNGGVYPSSPGLVSPAYMVLPSDRMCPETNAAFGYVAGLTPDPTAKTILLYDAAPAHGCRSWLFSTPDGRNVHRLDGTWEFLTEEQFQKEMATQPPPVGLPAPPADTR